MPLSASIFRRGGPKKELFDATAEDVQWEDDEQELQVKLKDLDELLHTEKIGRELSAAIWRPELQAAEAVVVRRNCTRELGFSYKHKLYFHIEEAVFLQDRGDLLFFVVDAQGKQRLLSIQEGYDLMVSCGVAMDRYQVYSRLKRSGYLIMRHPTRWVLHTQQGPHHMHHQPHTGSLGHQQPAQEHRQQPEETPQSVWGNSGAWRHTYPPRQEPSTSQMQHGPGEKAAAQDVAHPVGTVGPEAAHQPHTQPGQHDAAPDKRGEDSMDVDDLSSTAHDSSNAQAPTASRGMQRARSSSGGNIHGANGKAESGGGPQHQVWWPRDDGTHPYFAGLVSQECLDTCSSTPCVVIPRLGDALRSAFPRLKPFPRVSSTTRGLAAPSIRGHIVYDVYKPGSHVARNKGIFPAAHCHLTLCSGTPPSLSDQRLADEQAAAVCAGEGGSVAPVVWASVNCGDITLFGMRNVDLLPLM